MNKYAIHGVPRSGTTWLGELINSHVNVKYCYQPLFSYALKGYLTSKSSSDEIGQFYEELEHTQDSFILQTEARMKGKLPVFSKSSCEYIGYKEVRYHHIVENMLRQNMGIKFIFLLRNPLDNLCSWLNAPKEFRANLGWNVEEEWQYALKKNLSHPEEFNGYEKWKEANLLFLKLKDEFPDNVHLMNYKTLRDQTMNTVDELFNFLGFSCEYQTINFINEAQQVANSDSYSVYRKLETKYKIELPQEAVDFIYQDLKESPLHYLLA